LSSSAALCALPASFGLNTDIVGEGLRGGDVECGDVCCGEDLPVHKFVDGFLRDSAYKVMPRRRVPLIAEDEVRGGGTYQERGRFVRS